MHTEMAWPPWVNLFTFWVFIFSHVLCVCVSALSSISETIKHVVSVSYLFTYLFAFTSPGFKGIKEGLFILLHLCLVNGSSEKAVVFLF